MNDASVQLLSIQVDSTTTASHRNAAAGCWLFAALPRNHFRRRRANLTRAPGSGFHTGEACFHFSLAAQPRFHQFIIRPAGGIISASQSATARWLKEKLRSCPRSISFIQASLPAAAGAEPGQSQQAQRCRGRLGDGHYPLQVHCSVALVIDQLGGFVNSRTGEVIGRIQHLQ